MRRDHAPTFRRSDPCLALTAASRDASALELRVGGCKIFAVRRQYGMHAGTGQPLRRASSPEGLDGFIAVQVLSDAVAQGVRAVPE